MITLLRLTIVALFVLFFATGLVNAGEEKKADEKEAKSEASSFDFDSLTFDTIVLYTLQAQERLWKVKGTMVPALSEADYFAIIRNQARKVALQTVSGEKAAMQKAAKAKEKR